MRNVQLIVLLRVVSLRGLPLTLAILLLGACAPDVEPPRVERSVPVKTVVVEPTTFAGTVAALGLVEAYERIPVVAPAQGEIGYAQRFRNGLVSGVVVEAGERIGRVDNERARLTLIEVRLQAAAEERELARLEQALDDGILAEASYQHQLAITELARARLNTASWEVDRLEVVASRTGKLLVQEPVPPGSFVSPGSRLAEIVVDDRVKVTAWVAGADRTKVRTGQIATFESSHGNRGRARIAEIAPVVDVTGTVRFVADVLDPPHLTPGEGVELRVRLDPREEVLAVPRAAVVVSRGTESVYVMRPEGSHYRAERTPVQLGERTDGEIEILSGVRRGDRVAVVGVLALDDGVRAVESTDGGRGADSTAD